jgi:ArsR family transcriptional regulator
LYGLPSDASVYWAYTCIMTQIRKQRIPATPRQAAACCGPLDRLLNPAVFKAFADPTRVSLIACIAKCGRGCSVSEVAECCSVDLSVVSRHLSLLARSGVLEVTKEGRSVRYRVRYDDLSTLLRSIATALDGCCQPKKTNIRVRQ